MRLTTYSVRAPYVRELRAAGVFVGQTQEPLTEPPASAGGVRAPLPDLFESDEARLLLEPGRDEGSLSADAITLVLDRMDLDASEVDEFYRALEELQIEIVPSAAEAADAVEAEADEREVATDALQLFLKDIGKVPLLTA